MIGGCRVSREHVDVDTARAGGQCVDNMADSLLGVVRGVSC